MFALNEKVWYFPKGAEGFRGENLRIVAKMNALPLVKTNVGLMFDARTGVGVGKAEGARIAKIIN